MKRKSPTTEPPTLTRARIIRLYRFLRILSRSAQKREQLMRRLHLDIRGFYRDLVTLRQMNIPVACDDQHRYVLKCSLEDALSHLPFPDPQLSFHDISVLMQGDTPSHVKLRKAFESIVREPRTTSGEDF